MTAGDFSFWLVDRVAPHLGQSPSSLVDALREKRLCGHRLPGKKGWRVLVTDDGRVLYRGQVREGRWQRNVWLIGKSVEVPWPPEALAALARDAAGQGFPPPPDPAQQLLAARATIVDLTREREEEYQDKQRWMQVAANSEQERRQQFRAWQRQLAQATATVAQADIEVGNREARVAEAQAELRRAQRQYEVALTQRAEVLLELHDKAEQIGIRVNDDGVVVTS